MRRRILIFSAVILLLLLSTYLFRYSILRAAGRFLISEDSPDKVPAIFVLGGHAYDRGKEAARLFHNNYADHIFTTSQNIPANFLILNKEINESELTKLVLINNNVPSKYITALHRGTSTMEESEYILELCKQKGLKSIIIFSSKFHTRRIRYVFEDKFEENNINIIIRGAPGSSYNERKWWESEEGMIMVNNEYMKLFYYLYKY